MATLELLARAFAQLGQTPKAVSVLQGVARVHAEARQRAARRQRALRALLELDPSDADAQRAAGALLERRARTAEDAIELIEDDEDFDDVVWSTTKSRRSRRDAARRRRSSDAEREAQIARLMAECEVFLRYGLRDKMVAQLQRVLELDADHVEAREKLKDALPQARRGRSGAVTQLLMLAEMVGGRRSGRGARVPARGAAARARATRRCASSSNALARGRPSAPTR